MDEDDEIKLMVIQYRQATDNEKNAFWIKQSQTPFSTISKRTDIEMTVLSDLVNLYEKATLEEKEILWFIFKDRAQLYCDRKRWRAKFAQREEYKANLKALCPGADQDFYSYLVHQRYY